MPKENNKDLEESFASIRSVTHTRLLYTLAKNPSPWHQDDLSLLDDLRKSLNG